MLITLGYGQCVLKVPYAFAISSGVAKDAVVPVDVGFPINFVESVTGVPTITLKCFTQRHGRVRHPDNGGKK